MHGFAQPTPTSIRSYAGGVIMGVWFREQNQTYYCTIDGQQTKLGRSKRAAYEQYASLIGEGRQPTAGSGRFSDSY